jgi:hypothetical protein
MVNRTGYPDMENENRQTAMKGVAKTIIRINSVQDNEQILIR